MEGTGKFENDHHGWLTQAANVYTGVMARELDKLSVTREYQRNQLVEADIGHNKITPPEDRYSKQRRPLELHERESGFPDQTYEAGVRFHMHSRAEIREALWGDKLESFLSLVLLQHEDENISSESGKQDEELGSDDDDEPFLQLQGDPLRRFTR
ncbi:hypothetical protein Bca52824_008137 [Brassica carinata]|uniref:Uncharacterized protein n=1 Tax=Brassica carinata TaxID=52824 RepID=A0A8X7W7I9_BRACI|nr:hypothetical protein Bca52824_008137 [Brassica carinata]